MRQPVELCSTQMDLILIEILSGIKKLANAKVVLFYNQSFAKVGPMPKRFPETGRGPKGARIQYLDSTKMFYDLL